ncbi:peptide ABC transporter substrate-binding protein [Sedimentibacter hydroxybenzoicus DSM 7310]|uniref:Peptide ABC transporter substrate-binding protein n=1 Tax=Sedimentibacter hydroxybenzoicus DSM 7310 TaxID=1123245 RepID=A0A974GXL1_SEDHY|nr:ABC transporter substrate-binding protein [Sedimentibacter hydroxybenzoicus]NYB75712.1 peptide ABC transporter substrate-binding protein [Sedimentibacter hydroxybenzoicus DSM 7310]
MKKIVSILLVLLMVFSLAACGNNTTPPPAEPNEPGESNEQPGEQPAGIAESMTLHVGAYPDTIDPALNSAVDGATYIIHAFSGLVGYKQLADETLELYADLAKELPEAVETADGMVSYTYELKDGLKWSDGSDLTAQDFVYAWNRAVDPNTAADYEYMFDVIDGYLDVIGGVEGAKLNVTASEDGKSLTVVLPVDVPYFHELCAFPAFMPVKESIVEGNEDWATVASTYVGNGPYKVVEFSQSELVMQKNEFYHDADSIKTNELRFAFNDDDGSTLANFQNGSYLFIDQVPNEEIQSLQASHPDEFYITGQLGTYFVIFNVNDPAFAAFDEADKATIRKALGLMIDRNYIVEEIGQAGQVPAAGFVAMGLTEPDGTEYIANNGPNRDGSGYYSVDIDDYEANTAEAIELLKQAAESSGKFTVGDDGKVSAGFPTIIYITNNGTGHEAIAVNLQATFAEYGINMTIDTQEWATFLNTRKNGEYSVARHGWLGDYNDPISFLDMWITTSGNNDSQFGRGEHANYAGYSYKGESGKTWAESYDKLITEVKTSKDQVQRFDLMHQAEDILMSTGAVCPIYYYTDIFMMSTKLEGAFPSPLGFKYFMYAYVPQ